MAERAHLSIGEVLSLLQEEFPDVTISKIRFLESQGLLDPERTPSGYRKFYEPDIDRLRWILIQQRENFLPLRVIKDRLEESTRTGVPARAPRPSTPSRRATRRRRRRARSPAGDPHRSWSVGRQAAAAARRCAPSRRATPERSTPGPTSISLTRDELGAASGLHDRTITDLERFGLLAGRPMGRDTIYDEEALVVARIAAGFLRFGMEARHLRMYKTAAEREAGLFEQVILPLLKQRNPVRRGSRRSTR